MINIKQILGLSPDKRDLEIWKLIDLGPWKHNPDFNKDLDGGKWICLKCQKRIGSVGDDDPCPVPDQIALDWELAMKMRDECNEPTERTYFELALRDIHYEAESSTRWPEGFVRWTLCDAQPHHYLLAAIKAKESK